MLRAPVIEHDVLRQWVAIARRADVDEMIRGAHDASVRDVRASRPVCTASGRCCDFARTGHDLFVTGLEVAWTLDRIPTDRAIGGGDIDTAESRGDCPFLIADGSISRCGVHPARPMGCRVYFCDPTREQFVQDLAERGASLVREMHDRFGIPYVYAEWRALLRCFIDAGILSAPSMPVEFELRDPFVPLTLGSAS